MKSAFQLLLLSFIYIATSSYASDNFIQNPGFEIPPAPANLTTANATAGANSVAGWSINGTIWYVPSSSSSGSALQLGPNGKISQTIKATGGPDALDYILTFTVAAQNQDCANNLTALNVTLRDSRDVNASNLIHLQENSTRNLWERHALFLGRLGGGDYVHLQIESVTIKSQHNNVTCWPLVDELAVNRNQMPIWYNENMLSNGGFEVGPAFLKSSADGIILNEGRQDVFHSPLQEWSIIGTVRYIDSRHYRVPRGGAAVELLSGDPCGVQRDLINFSASDTYTLNFTVGDANDSCVGDFTVYVQVGSRTYNVTMQSNGTGSAFKKTLEFKVDEASSSETTTSIIFYSVDEMRTRDGLMCGPVLDDIFLTGSDGDQRNHDRNNAAALHGERKHVCRGSLFLAFVVMILYFRIVACMDGWI